MDRKPTDLLLRVGFSLGLLFCTYLVATRAVAQWHSRHRTADRLRKAIEWDPKNPMYHASLARVLQSSIEGGDPAEVTGLWQTAAQLSPSQADYWTELGSAYEISGRLDDARKAYDRAQQLFPNSPTINWRLANFCLRQGQADQALRALQKVLLGDARLRQQVFDLAWRAGIEPELILKAIIPPQPDVLFAYLRYLTLKKEMEAAAEVWNQLIALPTAFDPRAAFPYLDALIQEKQTGALLSAWKQLTERSPNLLRRQSYDTGLITNPDFEGQILNGGLGWRVSPVEGVVVSVDSLTFFDGTHSLKINFDGKHNVDYYHIFQFVPVNPSTSYWFNGYLRTKGITTDQGPRFEIYDGFDSSRLLIATENLIGTSNWAQQQLVFQTGPQTELLVVRLRRPQSRKFDNQIAGIAWIDRITLTQTK